LPQSWNGQRLAELKAVSKITAAVAIITSRSTSILMLLPCIRTPSSSNFTVALSCTCLSLYIACIPSQCSFYVHLNDFASSASCPNSHHTLQHAPHHFHRRTSCRDFFIRHSSSSSRSQGFRREAPACLRQRCRSCEHIEIVDLCCTDHYRQRSPTLVGFTRFIQWCVAT
jgi:hypothetical protein